MTGEPGIGVGFTLNANGKSFDARLALRKTKIGATEASIEASTHGIWSHALGIRGFHLEHTKLKLSLDAAQRLGVGVRAKMSIGGRQMDIAGKLLVHAGHGRAARRCVRRTPEQGDEQRPHVADQRPCARRQDVSQGRRRRVRAPQPLPARRAPGGGDTSLGIRSGFGIEGQLFAFGRDLAKVKGELDESPMLRLKGYANSVNLGAVALNRSEIDIKLGAVRNPHFMIRGGARVLVASKALDIRAGREKIYFATREKVGGLYEADSKYRANAGVRPAWAMDVALRNDFARTLEQDVSRRARAWADKDQARLRAKAAQPRQRQGEGPPAGQQHRGRASRSAGQAPAQVQRDPVAAQEGPVVRPRDRDPFVETEQAPQDRCEAQGVA